MWERATTEFVYKRMPPIWVRLLLEAATTGCGYNWVQATTG
jgi:hypothetical protein